MKVLIVNARCGGGSTGTIVADLYEMLCRHGHEVKVAYAHDHPTRVKISDTYRINDKVGYYIHNILSKITDRAGFYSYFQTKRFLHFIDGYKPDVIHLHNLHGYYIHVGLLFKYLAKKKVPVIWTLHDCWSFTGHCSHYSFQKCYRWKTQCYSCPLKKAYPTSFFLDQSKRNFKEKKDLFTSLSKLQIITPSEWLATQVRQSFLGKYPVSAIYNGIDLDLFKETPSNIRAQLGIANEKKMLLAVAFVWSKTKGLADLLKLNDKLDHSLYQLVIVGLSEEQKMQLPQTIIGLKRTNGVQELIQLYSAADVFLNTSYEETMGMVTAEALACGTPALVYDETAVPEVIDSKSGFIIHAGDVESLLDYISKACLLKKEDIFHRSSFFRKNLQYEKYYHFYINIFNRNRP